MKKAFTLVELAITLMILGLLVGGILTGQTLIRASELRSITTQHSAFQSAAFSFRDRYVGLPGDLPNASDFWPEATNGDGNKQIEPATVNGGPGEMFGFWQQLALTGMIEGAYTGTSGTGGSGLRDAIIGTNVPPGDIGPSGWSVIYVGSVSSSHSDFFAGSYDNAMIFGAKTSNDLTSAPVINPDEMWSLDLKVDDGIPSKGKVRAMKSLAAADDTGCSNTTTDQYAVQNEQQECAVIFSGY